MDHSYFVFIGFWIQRLLNKLVPELTKHTSWRTVEFFSPPLFFGNPELTWCWGAGCGWCWAPAALVGVCASKAACVLGHWHSVKGCGASCFGGCSMCPSRRLGSRGRGFETGNSAALPPGSSAGNTAHPQTRGSTNKDMKSHKKKMWHLQHLYLWPCTVTFCVNNLCVNGVFVLVFGKFTDSHFCHQHCFQHQQAAQKAPKNPPCLTCPAPNS